MGKSPGYQQVTSWLFKYTDHPNLVLQKKIGSTFKMASTTWSETSSKHPIATQLVGHEKNPGWLGYTGDYTLDCPPSQ